MTLWLTLLLVWTTGIPAALFISASLMAALAYGIARVSRRLASAARGSTKGCSAVSESPVRFEDFVQTAGGYLAGHFEEARLAHTGVATQEQGSAASIGRFGPSRLNALHFREIEKTVAIAEIVERNRT